MSLFLLFSLPLTLVIFLKEKYKNKISLNKVYFYVACVGLGFAVFYLLYLIHEFLLFESMQINYATLLSLGLSLLMQEQIYYYMLPLFIFSFFFTFNPNSLFKKNPILFTCFAFGVLFAKNFVIFLTPSKIYGTYEYLELPFIHIIELLITAFIIQYTLKNETKKGIIPYRFIFSSIFTLEILVVVIKELIIVNLSIYAFIVVVILVVILAIILKADVNS